MSFVNLILLLSLSFVNLILLLSPAQGRRDIELHVTHRALLFLGDATPQACTSATNPAKYKPTTFDAFMMDYFNGAEQYGGLNSLSPAQRQAAP